MLAARHVIFAVIATALLGACASNGVEGPSASFVPAGEATSSTAASGYTLNAQEKGLDCKRLTGKIQIRILELRTYASQTQASALSRTLQAASKPVFGGTSAGIDPNGEHARELAQIDAYNRELAAKDCRSFNLAAALASSDVPPAPTVMPMSKSAAVPGAPAKPR